MSGSLCVFYFMVYWLNKMNYVRHLFIQETNTKSSLWSTDRASI